MYFKAAEELAVNKLKSKFEKTKSTFFLPNLFSNKSISLKKKNNSILADNSNDDFISDININEQEDLSNKDNSILDYYENNPIKKEKKIYNQEMLKRLSKIVSQKINKIKNIDNMEKEKFIFEDLENIKNQFFSHEHEVEIDGQIFDKLTQMNIIANKMLKLYNIYSDKSIYNKNSLKVGNGKSMITQGMTINNFKKKYGFK